MLKKTRRFVAAFILVTLCALALWAAYPATDNFTRANAGTLGANWTGTTNVWSISSNQAVATTSSAYTIDAYTAESFNNDQTATITNAQANDQSYIGPCVRLTSGVASGYCVVIETATAGANYSIAKFVLGTRTNICNSSATFNVAVSTTLTLAVSGSTLTFSYNGVADNNCSPNTDSTYASGFPGMLGLNNGTTPTLSLFSADCVPTCMASSVKRLRGSVIQ